jgi:predicted dinucleotide-binding enzyme
MAKLKVGIVGRGNVGSALRRGLERAGYAVRACGKEPGKAREIAAWADVVVLAVPYPALDEAMREVGDAADGKPLVDATNVVAPPLYELALDPVETSGAEVLQGLAPKTNVVKAFNTVFADHMDSGKVKGERLTLFVAGDDASAKTAVRDMGRDIGFDAIDAGPLENARWMETLGYFNMQLAMQQRMGRDIGFKLIR